MKNANGTNEQQITYDEPDWLLQSLIDLVEKEKWQIGISLHISGFIVSGMLVGGGKYFAGVAEEISSSPSGGEPAIALSEAFTRLAKEYEKHLGEDLVEDQVSPTYRFIHLKQAKFFDAKGNSFPGAQTVWWRGRLSEVSSFIIGNIKTQKTQ